MCLKIFRKYIDWNLNVWSKSLLNANEIITCKNKSFWYRISKCAWKTSHWVKLTNFKWIERFWPLDHIKTYSKLLTAQNYHDNLTCRTCLECYPFFSITSSENVSSKVLPEIFRLESDRLLEKFPESNLILYLKYKKAPDMKYTYAQCKKCRWVEGNQILSKSKTIDHWVI